jgi:hypothetical protein
LAVGAAGVCLLLFILGAMKLLFPAVLIPVFLLIAGLSWREGLRFLKRIFLTPILQSGQINPIGFLAFYFSFIFACINFYEIIRPIPIGFDALSLYMNLPSLMSDYHGLVQGQQAYNWSILTSLGFTVFRSTPIALAISYAGGVLTLFAAYRLARRWLDGNGALLVCGLVYLIPSIVFQSSKDLKIDLGLLFISFSILLLFAGWVSGSPFTEKTAAHSGMLKAKLKRFFEQNSQMLLIGLLTGFAFGIKYTAFFLILGLIGGIWYAYNNYFGFLAATALAISGSLFLKLYSFSGTENVFSGNQILQWVLLGAGLLILGSGFFLRRGLTLEMIKKTIVLLVGIFLMFSPWMAKNLLESKKFTSSGLLYGEAASPEIRFWNFDLSPISPKPAQRKQASGQPSALNAGKGGGGDIVKSTAIREEIGRYGGYEKGSLRFLTLPYDLTTNINVKGLYVDIGFLLLLMLPLLFLFRRGNLLPVNLLIILMMIAVSGLSILTFLEQQLGSDHGVIQKFLAENQMNEPDSPFEYLYSFISETLGRVGLFFDGFAGSLIRTNSLALSILTLLLVAVFFAFREKISQEKLENQSTGMVLLLFSFFWLLYGAGIVWYGYLMFAGFMLLMVAALYRASKQGIFGKGLYYFGLGAFLIWGLLSLTYRMTGNMPNNERTASRIEDPNMTAYKMGKLDERQVLKQINPAIPSVLSHLNRTDSDLIYRAGTLIHYFIRKNDKRVFIDNQLDVFNQIYNRAGKDKLRTVKGLRAMQYRYLLIDLNTPTIDRTPDKSLTRKYNTLIAFVTDNPKATLIETDRLIPTGRKNAQGQSEVIKGLTEPFAKRGSLALIRLED